VGRRLAVIQLAKLQECKVIGTAGTKDGLAPISALCAQAASQKRYIAEIKMLSPEGVDVMLKMGAHINLGADLPLLRRDGTVVVIGNQGMTETNVGGKVARALSRYPALSFSLSLIVNSLSLNPHTQTQPTRVYACKLIEQTLLASARRHCRAGCQLSPETFAPGRALGSG
jgi:NADPH:quinone reductase-like Zn-dependent oxidoreductase